MSISFSDKFICISPRDRTEYEKKFSCKIDTVFSVTLDDKAKCETLVDVDTDSFMFVGSYFKPNIDGTKWLAENVAPYIKAPIKIVGRNMEKIADDNQNAFPSNLHIIGGVDDLGKYYENAAAIVMPIFSGSGMKVKTAEAMMYGKPIIATDEALMGYDVDNVEGIYRCNTADEFLKAMQDVLNKRKTYYGAVREYYLEYCNTERLLSRAHSMMEELMTK